MDSFHFWNSGHSLFLPSLEATAVRLKRRFTRCCSFHQVTFPNWTPDLTQKFCPSGSALALSHLQGRHKCSSPVPEHLYKLASRSSLVFPWSSPAPQMRLEPELGLATCSPRCCQSYVRGGLPQEHGHPQAPSECFPSLCQSCVPLPGLLRS